MLSLVLTFTLLMLCVCVDDVIAPDADGCVGVGAGVGVGVTFGSDVGSGAGVGVDFGGDGYGGGRGYGASHDVVDSVVELNPPLTRRAPPNWVLKRSLRAAAAPVVVARPTTWWAALDHAPRGESNYHESLLRSY